LGALVALAAAAALVGCSEDFDSNQAWFRKPLDVLGGARSGYKFSDLQESKLDRPIGPSDLIEPNGSCPAPAVAAPPPAPSNQAASPAAPQPLPAAADASSLLGEGVGLGMSECEVVYRAGPPSNVQLGQNPNGDRTAVLTFGGGPRPGIYRFERGRLVEMDRTAEPEPPPRTGKKPAKSKKPKSSNPA
jgi:hypothetical protein